LLTLHAVGFQYIDPIRTYIVDTYGVSLRFEEKSVDDEARVTRWFDPIAPGLREAKEKPAVHAADFISYPHKAKEREIPTEKITYRCLIVPLLALKSLSYRTLGALRFGLLAIVMSSARK
jgi:hypothetical protein